MGMAEVGDSINGNWVSDNVELIKETFEDLKSSFAPDPILTTTTTTSIRTTVSPHTSATAAYVIASSSPN
jgi:hypothetical protein